MRDYFREVGLVWRSLVRRPGFLLGSLLTLALGLGANIAALGTAYASWWRPLPFPTPDELVLLWEKSPEYGESLLPASPANFLAWRSSGSAFSDVTAYSEGLRSLALTGQGEPRMVDALSVYGNFFSVLGVPPKLGRPLTEQESWPGPPAAVVLSEHLWRDLGADPALVGRAVVLDDIAYTVVGVMPERFGPPLPRVDLWVPLRWRPGDRGAPIFRIAHYLRPLGRLKADVSAAEATAFMRATAARLEAAAPSGGMATVAGVTSLHEWFVGARKGPLSLLLVASAMVLLIACANVANLQLARTAAREGELALRSAVGASRGQLARLLLLEGLVLSVLGGGAGLLLGWAALRVGRVLAPPDLPLVELGAGAMSLLFGLLAVLVAAPAIGLVPALQGSRRQARPLTLTMGRGGLTGPRSHLAGKLLIGAEMAFATLLLISAGLLCKSFLSLSQVDLGFQPKDVLVASLALPPIRYAEPAKVSAFYDQLLEHVEHLPGVRSAAVVDGLPLTGLRWSGALTIEGRPSSRTPMEFSHRTVSARHLETFGVKLREGRFFDQQDARAAQPVAVVNDSLARQFFSGESPVGRRISFEQEDGEPSGWRTIIGVVADEKLESPAAEPRPALLELYSVEPQWSMSLALRAEGEPARLAAAIRRAVASLDPDLPVAELRPLGEVVYESTAHERFLMLVVGAFAALAFLLAAIGVFALTYQVGIDRSRDVCIRLALGATRRDVRRWVLRQSALPGLAGLLIGVAGAMVSARLLQRFLFGISALDATTFGLAIVLLGLTLCCAAYLPARRVATADPLRVLR